MESLGDLGERESERGNLEIYEITLVFIVFNKKFLHLWIPVWFVCCMPRAYLLFILTECIEFAHLIQILNFFR